MKNIFERLLLFIIGVPLILAIPLFFNQFNFLVLYLLCVVVIIIGVTEIHKILSTKYSVYNIVFFIAVAILNFVSLYFFSYNKMSGHAFLQTFVMPIMALTILELYLSQKNGFEHSLQRITSGFFILLYPIWLGDFFMLLTLLNNARLYIVVFFIIVFSCDSLAWLFGMLFGNKNRGIIAASPKKSVAGFIGVGVSAVVLSILAYYFLPEFNTFKHTFLIMLCTHAAAVLGDLFESVVKRSVGVKDSGKIILGRGGILDTIDSMLFAAPMYFFLCRAFYVA